MKRSAMKAMWVLLVVCLVSCVESNPQPSPMAGVDTAALADDTSPATDVMNAEVTMLDTVDMADICIPICEDEDGPFECGDDGCGGSCGDCGVAIGGGSYHCLEGACVWKKSGGMFCDESSECGSEHCVETWMGSICVETCVEDCPNGWICEGHPRYGPDMLFVCVPICLPDCEGKECGDDGCGGACGECEDDDDVCTEAPVCDQGNCGLAPISGCCDTAVDCDDDDLCTQELCDRDLHVCVYHDKAKSPACDDGDPCTEEGCDPQTGDCTHAVNTSIESCQNIPCWGGMPWEANTMCDIDPCFVPECDYVEDPQCTQAPLCGTCTIPENNEPNVDCDDEDPCTEDLCEIGIGCQHEPDIDNLDCFCTELWDCLPLKEDACDDVQCLVDINLCQVFEKDCDDGIECTFDYCDPMEGCMHALPWPYYPDACE